MKVVRGYVKWEDENGVFHKIPLAEWEAQQAAVEKPDDNGYEDDRDYNSNAE